MKHSLIAIGILLTMATSLSGQTVVDFEELTLFTGESPAGGGMFYNGNDGSGTTNSDGWMSQGLLFSNDYNGDSLPAFDFWGGWAYSNVVNTTTVGFTNQYASFAGGGSDGLGGVAAGENYAIAFQPGAYFDVPANLLLQSLEVTNVSYTALSMRDGDTFAKQFGGPSGDDPDLFQVTFTGYDGPATTGAELGAVSVPLADFRFADNSQDFILDEWLTVDLSPLAGARSVGLTFESTDVGNFGINTPTYLAVDNIRLTAVPEPNSLGLIAAAATAMLGIVRRRRAWTLCG